MTDPIVYGEKEKCNITLVVGEQEFHTRKIKIGGASDFFEVMFYGDFKEANQDRVEIKEVDVKAFRRLLDFIHKGDLTNLYEYLTQTKKYLDIGTSPNAYKSSVHVIPGDCGAFVANFWKSTNDLLNLADCYNVEGVRSGLFAYIRGDHCSLENCFVCFNSLLFARKHKEWVHQKMKHYSKATLNEWLRCLKKKDLGCDLDVTELADLMDELTP